MLADGANGSVEFRGDHIIIRRKGFANVLTQGLQGDKAVPLSSITAVQFRPAGSMTAGYLQFTLMGGREFRGGLLEATKDENAVMFDKSQERTFLAVRDAVQASIFETGGRVVSGSGKGSADELTKLAALFEKGHLTHEEFDSAKRAVLHRPAPPVSPHSTSLQTTELPDRRMTDRVGCTVGCLGAIAIVVLLIALSAAGAPQWGELGYKPKISEKCRAVWASANVDSDRYVQTVCTPEEQHEIAGYRPES